MFNEKIFGKLHFLVLNRSGSIIVLLWKSNCFTTALLELAILNLYTINVTLKK